MYTGLGMWPEDVCFDPARASWLPYWLDNFNEEHCRYSGSLPDAKVRAILDSNENAGGHLTVENRDKATDLAYQAYNELIAPIGSPIAPESKPLDWVPVALVVGGIAALSLLKR